MNGTNRPEWVRVCDHPGCIITADHTHGMNAEQWAAYLASEAGQ